MILKALGYLASAACGTVLVLSLLPPAQLPPLDEPFVTDLPSPVCMDAPGTGPEKPCWTHALLYMPGRSSFGILRLTGAASSRQAAPVLVMSGTWQALGRSFAVLDIVQIQGDAGDRRWTRTTGQCFVEFGASGSATPVSCRSTLTPNKEHRPQI